MLFRSLLANGRGASLDPAEPLARETYLAVGELSGGGAEARVACAAPLAESDVERLFGPRIATVDEIRFDAATRALRARRERRLGALTLSSAPLPVPPGPAAAAALLEGVREVGLQALPWSKGLAQWRDRIAFLRRAEGDAWPDLSDEALLESLADWLGPCVADRTALDRISPDELRAALEARLPWELRRRLDREAPTHFEAPSGSRLPIRYEPDGPVLAVRVQELFGLAEHPTIAGVPLTLELLSPAQRPVQVTRDLPGFWRGSYQAVKAEMKGRYPKHPWPDDPLQAPATARAKPRGA